jgi:hypothetical protein
MLVFWGRERKENTKEFLVQWFCKYRVCSVCYLHEHMILLTGNAHLTEKVLWHYELNCQQVEIDMIKQKEIIE